MNFNSISFLVFFPVVTITYFLIPNRLKNIWLLATSYYFYMSWNAKYAILILISTIVTWISSLSMDKKDRKNKRIILIISLAVNLSILFFFKYSNFIISNMNIINSLFHFGKEMEKINLLLPVGISFYTFQALGYTIDVYRGDIKAERSFINYSLFVSFFPQLVAGPIERSKNLLKQINEIHFFNYEKMVDGLLMMVWGFFLKICVADRISIFVDAAYGDIVKYPGYYLLIATFLFSIQIYCDFNGYTMIARGAGRVLGYDLQKNFNAPYLSKDVKTFWRNWHLSLTTWFKDYVYIPLGGNKKGRFRTYINILIVFIISGLWHGAGWSFIVWGLLNGLYQVIGDILLPFRNKLVDALNLNRNSFSHKLGKTTLTFLLINLTWIFFRSSQLTEAIEIIKSIVKVKNIQILFDNYSLFQLGLDEYDFRIMIIFIVIVFISDVLMFKKINALTFIKKQDYWFRWLVYVCSILVIIVFGVWGSGYNAGNFIYFQF